MFLVLFILGWILVHGATKGRYILSSPRNVKQEVAGIVLAISMLCGMVGMFAGGDISFQGAGILAAITWFGILLMRTSLVDHAAQRKDEENLQAQLETRRKARAERKAAEKVASAVKQIPEPRSKDGRMTKPHTSTTADQGKMQPPPPPPPQVTTVGRSWDGSFRVAESRQEELQQRFNSGDPLSPRQDEAVANVLHVEQPEPADGYHSDADEVMQIARDTIGSMSKAKPTVQPSREAVQPVLGEDPVPQVVESAPAPEPEFVPQQGWSAPKIEHTHYELDNAGDKPVSIFGSGSSSSAGGGQSLFGGGEQRPQRARAAPEVDKLLAQNRLGNDEELTRPQAVLAGTDTPGAIESSAPQPPDDGNIVEAEALLPDSELTQPKKVLEDAEKGQGPGFHYKPTEGIKSRF